MTPIDRAPHSTEAEQAVLSAMMMDERATGTVLGILDADAFYREPHRRIFKALGTCFDHGIPPDVTNLADQLERAGELDAVGGRDYLTLLIDVVPTSVNVAYHAEIVREKYALRRLIVQATETVQLCYEGREPAQAIAQKLSAECLPLAVENQRQGYQRADPFPVLEEIERRHLGTAVSFRSGIAALDAHTNGFRLGELIILGAVAKAGKSVVAHHMAVTHMLDGHGVGIVSAEMRASQAIERMLNSLGRVPAAATSTGRLQERDWSRLATAAGQIRSGKLWIDDAATPSFLDVRTRATALKAKHPEVTMIVVDFLQLVRYELRGRRGDEELMALTYGLKGLAKSLEAIVIAPCQLNYKDIEKRPDKRPELQDLQGSSGMVQAADFCILLYRPRMYFDTAEPKLELIAPAGGVRRTDAFTAVTYWRGDLMTVTDSLFDSPAPPIQRDLLEETHR